MKAYDIIGWAYDGAIYCDACLTAEQQSIATPVFATDEWYDPQAKGRQVLACDSCGIELDEYENTDLDEDE